MHTCALSNCELSKHILNICFIEIKTWSSLTMDNYCGYIITADGDDIARRSDDSYISLEATKSGHGFGNLTSFRFKMELYPSFAHGHGITAWKDSHLSHNFSPGVPWWLHGTFRMPKKKNRSFSVPQFLTLHKLFHTNIIRSSSGGNNWKLRAQQITELMWCNLMDLPNFMKIIPF